MPRIFQPHRQVVRKRISPWPTRNKRGEGVPRQDAKKMLQSWRLVVPSLSGLVQASHEMSLYFFCKVFVETCSTMVDVLEDDAQYISIAVVRSLTTSCFRECLQ